MFSSVRNFLYRHRRKFIITGALFGGVYFLINYAQRKPREWQEKEAKKFFEMTRKKQHFESTERTCNQTILSLSKIVSESVLCSLNTGEIVHKLQENPENKLELWEQLKVMIFTRICVLVYALSILQVTLRVQLNIIGGYLYRDLQEHNRIIDGNLQAKYLSLYYQSYKFVSQGVEELIKQIDKVVKQVVEPVSLKKKITLHEVEQMFWSIQTVLCTDTTEGDPVKKMVHYLIGHRDISEAKLNTLLKEAMDILESDEVTSLTMSSVSHSFSSVVDEIESTERTCNQTILSLSQIVSESVLCSLNTEEIVHKLQENPENKLELWEQLKVMIFTRICVLVYALSILQVTLRVQLNIIGGHLYRDLQEHNRIIDGNLQAKYLSLYYQSYKFVSQGVEELIKQIDKVVKQVVEPVSLKKKITLHEVEQMFWSIQTVLCTDTTEGDPVKKMVHYLIGHRDISEAKLDTLLKEAMDILESDEVTSLTMSSVSHSFSSVVDEIANLFVTKSMPTTKNDLEIDDNQLYASADPFVDVNKVELHFVKLLPLINELVTKNTCKGNTNIPDMLTQHLTLNEKLKLLSANIYEGFSSE